MQFTTLLSHFSIFNIFHLSHFLFYRSHQISIFIFKSQFHVFSHFSFNFWRSFVVLFRIISREFSVKDKVFVFSLPIPPSPYPDDCLINNLQHVSVRYKEFWIILFLKFCHSWNFTFLVRIFNLFDRTQTINNLTWLTSSSAYVTLFPFLPFHMYHILVVLILCNLSSRDQKREKLRKKTPKISSFFICKIIFLLTFQLLCADYEMMILTFPFRTFKVLSFLH
jgi:hypothetical protein